MRVAIITEGTYPTTLGGVSYWVHNLIDGMPDIEFVVVAIVPTKEPTIRFAKPPNLKEIIFVPVPHKLEEFSDIEKTDLVDEMVEEIIQFHKNIKNFKFVEAYKNLKKVYPIFLDNPMKIWRHKLLWKFLEEYYKKINPKTAFFKWLVSWKNTHAPLLSLLATKMPEADVYHATNSGYPGLAALLGKILYGGRTLVTDHGLFIRELRIRIESSLLDKIEKLLWIRTGVSISIMNYHLFDLVTTVCEFNKRWVIENVGIPAKKIKVVYNGIDTDYFRPLLVPRDPYLVGTIARVYDIKNIKDFIKAAKYVVKRVPEAKFVVIGPVDDPVYWDECNRLVEMLDLKEKFQFIGPTTNTLFWYNSISVFVLSSASEGFPLSTIEAMACGTPVIVTDVGGAGEAVGKCGFVVPPYNPRKLGEKIVWLLTHQKEREQMGLCARERAVKYFSQKKFIREFKKIYTTLARKERVLA
ncbi:MAG: GT4 family glycosyltransferase PelF [Candidatus Odinarchaeota archaeon]|nr:GT4 family glycosyltransferase PelF [Candidatus Odinarchaeota archaeon]